MKAPADPARASAQEATQIPSGATSRSDSEAPARPAVKLASEKAKPIAIARFERAPVIDGKLDDEVWRSAPLLSDFYQIRPGDNLQPAAQTEVRLGYDATNLYVSFYAHDKPGRVRATVAKRDDVANDDSVALYLDTFNDQRRAYILIFNPLGIQADGIFTEGADEDFSVDIVMESKGLLTADGYTIEAAIPFKSLRFESGQARSWGVHFMRRIKWANNELDSWMPISRDRSSFLGQAGHIIAPTEISSEHTLELIPSLTFSETGRRVATLSPSALATDPTLRDPGRFVNEPVKIDPGLTAKFGITSNITLDLALNPDFAQVEADQTVVTANQRFPIFYEEKRPFFLEGIDIFRTPLTAVHTRAIIDPDIAVKLSGKRGPNTFGLLLASDNGPGNFIGDERLDRRNFPFLDKNAYIGVLRLKHDLAQDSTIGMIATTYNFIQEHNQLGGFDGRFRLDPQTVFTFQVLGTTTRRRFFDPDLGQRIYRTGNALGYYWDYDKQGRHFGYELSGVGRMRDYSADVGFTRRTNTNYESLFLSYNSEPKPKAKLISYNLISATSVNFDWQGRAQNWDEESQITLNFPRQTFFNAGISGGYERLFEEEFGPKRTATRGGAFAGSDSERSTFKKSFFAGVGTTPSKKYSAQLFFGYGWGTFDLDFGAGPKYTRVSPAALADPGNPDVPLDPGPGKSLNLNATFIYQPTDALRASFDYIKSRLVRNDTGGVAFDENIVALRATYQFTRFTFFRARVDYDSLFSNVRGQFLLGWAPNPGTSFYVGYNDDLNRNGFSPFTGQLEPGFRRNGRTFFIKMSYLFRRSL